MQAVIVSFESLATNSLGCYGNDWIETPHWDRLAATGAVFDRHFADTPGPLAGMSWANGQSASRPDSARPVALGNLLKTNGVAIQLITAVEDSNWQHAADFQNTQTVKGLVGIHAQPDEVPFAHVVKAALSVWNESSFRERPRLLWLHSAGPSAPPQGFDSLYFEDFEERGHRMAELSDEARAEHPAVYAGAVSLLDHWLGELLATIESDVGPTLVIVMAAQGHLWHHVTSAMSNAGQSTNGPLNDQLVRAPLILKVIGDERFRDLGSLRSDRLVQTCDLIPTLLDWFGINLLPDLSLAGQSWLRELTEEVPPRKSVLIGSPEGPGAVRTPDWLCVRETHSTQPADGSESIQQASVSLFAKPEDIWDVNNVASQQPEVVSELLSHIPHGR